MNPLHWIKLASIVGALLIAAWIGRQTMATTAATAQAKADRLAIDRDAWAQKAGDVLLVLNAEREKAKAFDAIAAHYEQDKSNASQSAYDRALADVRAGRVRVRFPTCRPAVPAAPTSAGEPDAEAADGRDIAAAAIGAGAACDAHVASLQALLISERQ